MFEDSIWFEDNHLFKLVQDDFHRCRGSIFNIGWYVSHHADRLLSKDSPIVQYTVGSYGPSSSKSSHFYNHFPRKASNLDGEHHYISVDHEMVRWLPRKITKQIFPERNGKFTAYPVPTLEELALCNERHGRAYWNRAGIWTCSCDEVDDSSDEHGPQIFEKYEEYVSWRRKMDTEDIETS